MEKNLEAQRDMTQRLGKDCRIAFTLVEFLVVIAIFAVLTGLLMSAVQQARAASARVECLNNLRQMGVALQSYHGTYYAFPPRHAKADGTDPYPNLGWQGRILPFVDRSNDWEQVLLAFRADMYAFHNPPHRELSQVVSVYTCPSDGRVRTPTEVRGILVSFTSYVGVEGRNQFDRSGVLFNGSSVRFDEITDGTSNTLMVGDRPPSSDLWLGWWYAGEGQSMDGSADMILGSNERLTGFGFFPGCPPGIAAFGPGRVGNQCDALHFWSLHSGGANFLFCDSSVRFLSYSARDTLPSLATRAGGETVDLP